MPDALKFDILSACHGDIYSGHFGIERTFARLQLKYFWSTMFQDTQNFVASCIECGSRKSHQNLEKLYYIPSLWLILINNGL
jgi:hypothetical protein